MSDESVVAWDLVKTFVLPVLTAIAGAVGVAWRLSGRLSTAEQAAQQAVDKATEIAEMNRRDIARLDADVQAIKRDMKEVSTRADVERIEDAIRDLRRVLDSWLLSRLSEPFPRE